MPTHQAIGGASDESLLQRMVATHGERFGAAYWTLFDRHVAPHLPSRPVMIDLGCGPGLLLRDLAAGYPAATLHGYDVTPAMVAHAQGLSFNGATVTIAALDVTTRPLPHAAGAVHLVSMASVLHVLDEPWPVLAEIRRVLAPGGVLLLQDWIRQSLATYLAWRRDALGETEAETGRGFRLFPVHNKYTVEDWRWLLAQAGFGVSHDEQIRASHRVFVARRA